MMNNKKLIHPHNNCKYVIAMLLSLSAKCMLFATGYVVTNSNAAGSGSLRAAITSANASTSTPHSITFSASTAFVITLDNTDGGLPALTKQTTIDGTTSGHLVEIDGSALSPGANGITVSANSCIIKGLYIHDFIVETSGVESASGIAVHANDVQVDGNVLSLNKWGVQIYSGTNCQVTNNKIGTNTAGNVAKGNTVAGILCLTTAVITNNLISANAVGIKVSGSANIIKGNKIGTDDAGTSGLGNAGNGIVIDGASQVIDNEVGGTGSGEANTIAYNGANGIEIKTFSGSHHYNKISRNLIFYNSQKAIQLNYGTNQGNDGKPIPTDITFSGLTISGKAQANDVIELFLASGPQYGYQYMATVSADGSGDWTYTLSGIFSFYIVATASDASGSHGEHLVNTSEFASITTLTGGIIGSVGSGSSGSTVTVTCDDCIGSFAPIPGKIYVLSAWVSEVRTGSPPPVITYTDAQIDVTFRGSSTIYGPFLASGSIIDGWQKIETEFVIPSGATEVSVHLHNAGSNKAYFDDIRIFPKKGNMKSFVYDPVTLRLMAEMDENNYATFYEYDEEGALIRVKKETERGVKTIKESGNNSVKLKRED